MLFIDVYTQWCGPCKKMVREVFPQPEVGSYLNEHFVCIQLDAETPEGKSFSGKYDVGAYPTFYVLDSVGEVQYREVGYKTASQLLVSLSQKVGQNPWLPYEQQWQAGNRDYAFVRSYLTALEREMLLRHCADLADEYLSAKPDSEVISDSLNFLLFKSYCCNPRRPYFQQICTHMDLIEARWGSPLANKLRERLASLRGAGSTGR